MAAVGSSSAIAANSPEHHQISSPSSPLLGHGHSSGQMPLDYRLESGNTINSPNLSPLSNVIQAKSNTSIGVNQYRSLGSSIAVNIAGLTALGSKASSSNSATDLRLRSASGTYKNEHISNIITSFKKPQFTVISKLVREVRCIFKDRRAKRSLYLIGFNVIGTCLLSGLCRDTNSMALLAFTYLSVFHLFILLTCPLSVWVEQQRPNPAFTFGYGRFEVLAIFSCTVLASVGSLFLFKDCIERLMLPSQPVIKSGVLTGTSLAFIVQLVVIYGTDSKAWTHVIRSSKSSCLQVWLTEFSENLCQLMPGLSRILLPRINPFILLANLGAVSLFVAHWIVQLKGYHAADTFAAVVIIILACIALLPMCVYTGMILLQTTPSHVLNQLEKCLREAATLDGVLEFRNEHFWTVSFGVMAGSLHVRIRRDANEQLVLAHLTSRLSSLIHVLTIQVFKDDWTRSTTTIQMLNESARVASTSISSSSSSSSSIVSGSSPQWLNSVTTSSSSPLRAQSDFSTLSIFADRQVTGQQRSTAGQPRV